MLFAGILTYLEQNLFSLNISYEFNHYYYLWYYCFIYYYLNLDLSTHLVLACTGHLFLFLFCFVCCFLHCLSVVHCSCCMCPCWLCKRPMAVESARK
jgi:hypothetical protein